MRLSLRISLVALMLVNGSRTWAAVDANLIIQREIRSTLEQYNPFKKLYDAVTDLFVSPPKAIERYETVELPFLDKCRTPFFLDNESIVCAISADKKPVSKEEPTYYLLNLEIKLKTGKVTPHPELSVDYPDGHSQGKIACYDPVARYVQIVMNPLKPHKEREHLQGYWGGKLEKTVGELFNDYSCRPSERTNIALLSDEGLSQLREGDGVIAYTKRDKSEIGTRPDGTGRKEKVVMTNKEYGRLIHVDYFPYLPFMDAYLFGNEVPDCGKGKATQSLILYSRERGLWRWAIPDAVRHLTVWGRGCGTLYARPVKTGMVWFNGASSEKSTSIHFQPWDKPDKVIKLADGPAHPMATSPDGCLVIYVHENDTFRNPKKAGSVYRMTNFCKEAK